MFNRHCLLTLAHCCWSAAIVVYLWYAIIMVFTHMPFLLIYASTNNPQANTSWHGDHIKTTSRNRPFHWSLTGARSRSVTTDQTTPSGSKSAKVPKPKKGETRKVSNREIDEAPSPAQAAAAELSIRPLEPRVTPTAPLQTETPRHLEHSQTYQSRTGL